MSRRIGVLAVQGAFAEHVTRLRQLGYEALEIRQQSDVMRLLDGLVLPGGESTAQAKLLDDLGMKDPIQKLIQEGLPVLGTCAGLILLAQDVESTGDGCDAVSARRKVCEHAGYSGRNGCAHDSSVITPEGFRTLPVAVRRNGYGRQLGSFVATAPLVSGDKVQKVPLVFIRAPRIVAIGDGVQTLVSLDGEPVAVRFGNQIGCCFHPELSTCDTLYDIFCH